MAMTEESPKEEILSWERELLGFYLTEHPLAKLAKELDSLTTVKIAEIDGPTHNGKIIKIGGIIAQIRKTLTKVRKEEMCFLKLQDTTGTQEIVVFPRIYASAKNYLNTDQIVIVAGRVEAEEQQVSIIAEEIESLAAAAERNAVDEGQIEVTIPTDADRILLSKIYETLRGSPGKTQTYLILPGTNGSPRKFQVPFGASRSLDLEERLENLGCKILN